MKTDITIRLCILKFLRDMPEGHLQKTETICSHVHNCQICATDKDIRDAIRKLESLGYILGKYDAMMEDTRWAITDAGDLYLDKDHL